MKETRRARRRKANQQVSISIDDPFCGVYDVGGFLEESMARKNKLMKEAAERIGSAMGRANRTAHKVAKAGVVAKKELEQISKQVESLKKQLQKTTKRLRKALA